MRSLFVYDPHDLEAPVPGGVQLCSREFLEIVRAASDKVELVPVAVTKAPLWRLCRLFCLGSYLFYRPKDAYSRLAKEVASVRPTHIFLNRSELIRIAPLAAELAPDAKIVIMSHGNQSGDDLYEVAGPRGRRNPGLKRMIATWQLGLDLTTESCYRHRYLDAVCVMSEEEETLERWLGAATTVILPRIIRPRPLDWKPVSGRVGFVGTLNHTPNRAALEELCGRIAFLGSAGLQLRLVGGPENIGRELAAKYQFVHYLGRLDDEAIRLEASTWSLFINPIFWLSRGASMKLSQSLSWAIPCLSTRSGARGYRIPPETIFKCEDSAGEFARELMVLIDRGDRLASVRKQLLLLADKWPDAVALGRELKHGLR